MTEDELTQALNAQANKITLRVTVFMGALLLVYTAVLGAPNAHSRHAGTGQAPPTHCTSAPAPASTPL